MSKGHSGLFRETNGDKIARGINSAIQKEKAFEYAKDIYENGTTAEKRFINTVTVVYDEENNKYYYGMNGGIELHNTPKNAILFGDKTHEGILPKKKLNKFPLGNCSEVDAVNQALNAGAKLEHLHLTTLDVKRKNIRKHNIVGKCSCKNFTTTFKGRVKKNHTEWED